MMGERVELARGRSVRECEISKVRRRVRRAGRPTCPSPSVEPSTAAPIQRDSCLPCSTSQADSIISTAHCESKPDPSTAEAPLEDV